MPSRRLTNLSILAVLSTSQFQSFAQEEQRVPVPLVVAVLSDTTVSNADPGEYCVFSGDRPITRGRRVVLLAQRTCMFRYARSLTRFYQVASDGQPMHLADSEIAVSPEMVEQLRALSLLPSAQRERYVAEALDLSRRMRDEDLRPVLLKLAEHRKLGHYGRLRAT